MEATNDHAHLCFSTLHSDLLDHPTKQPAFPNHSGPIFVSWTRDKVLRGCIGYVQLWKSSTFSSSPLHTSLPHYARAAASDSRFPPITASELPNLTCHVSLLHSFEDVDGWLDWVPGVHGIRIYWSGLSATFLPHVILEQVCQIDLITGMYRYFLYIGIPVLNHYRYSGI